MKPWTTRIETQCPTCGCPHNLHRGLAGADQPEVGDFTLCWGCQAPAVFELGPLGVLTLRPPTVAEELELARDGRIAAAIDAMRVARSPYDAAAQADEALRDAGRSWPSEETDDAPPA